MIHINFQCLLSPVVFVYSCTWGARWPSRLIPPELLSLLMVPIHYNDVIMSALASQFTSGSIVCSTVGSGADQRKHQSSASLAFVRGIHQWPGNSPHKGPLTQKMYPFDNVIICFEYKSSLAWPIYYHFIDPNIYHFLPINHYRSYTVMLVDENSLLKLL